MRIDWASDANRVIDTLDSDDCNCEEFHTCQNCKDRDSAQAALGANAFRWVADLLTAYEQNQQTIAKLNHDLDRAKGVLQQIRQHCHERDFIIGMSSIVEAIDAALANSQPVSNNGGEK